MHMSTQYFIAPRPCTRKTSLSNSTWILLFNKFPSFFITITGIYKNTMLRVRIEITISDYFWIVLGVNRLQWIKYTTFAMWRTTTMIILDLHPCASIVSLHFTNNKKRMYLYTFCYYLYIFPSCSYHKSVKIISLSICSGEKLIYLKYNFTWHKINWFFSFSNAHTMVAYIVSIVLHIEWFSMHLS